MTVMSCSGDKTKSSTGAYTLTCTAEKRLGRDSATLYIVEDNYRCLTNGALSTTKPGGTFKWQGHIDGAKAAFIKFNNDTTLFYLVLGPGNTEVKIGATGWKIEGTSHNNEYVKCLSHRNAIIKAKSAIFRDYMKYDTDSTLTEEIERDFLARDSVMADSLQRYMVECMSTGDPVAMILKERFFNTLTKEYMRKL